MEQTFYSNGKLLITGEYLVLDGATALALPTSYGQSLTVKSISEKVIRWESIDEQDGVWFKGEFTLENFESTIPSNIATTLTTILSEARKLNSDFATASEGFEVITKLNFPKDWGLGSSSTLINNIAQWANVDAFILLENSFGGSGYDIAAAQNDIPVFFKKTNPPRVTPVHLPWGFTDQLWFIHLNQKQDSKEGIKRYRNVSTSPENIQKITDLTSKLLLCYSLDSFEKIMNNHETIVSEIIQLPTVKSRLFSDYPHTIKSLGAWGGDFILATGDKMDMEYFRKKGYPTILPYKKMIK
ncbi:GYDIA family GHMP kinase [Jejudonia soesokkakensis]|uniref:GYDIA family GHMP kinase n=1 Tax=Jejudonia soesokkakensis TaxID=1323432 RepID=A0ABW2MPH5_9FLAO